MSDLLTSIRTRLTATPSKATLGFFDRNLVIEKRRRLVGVLDGVSKANAAHRVSRRAEPANQYPYVQAVADGVNVGYDIYRIKTEVSEKGVTVKAGHDYQKRDRLDRMLSPADREEIAKVSGGHSVKQIAAATKQYSKNAAAVCLGCLKY